jgi:O-antigen ligase
MKQAAGWTGNNECETRGIQPRKRLSFLRFLMRYPIFLLAFGPPVFRSSGIDITQGQVDVWSLLQTGLLCAVTIRAVLRLAAAESVFIPKQIRSILKYALFLGLLFLVSAIYSPSHFATAAYSFLYLFTIICVTEFIVDVYRNPPDWVQCLFHLRFISFLMLVVVLFALAVNPELVMQVLPGEGIRLRGGAVAPVTVICPMIALISAYSFLHTLEARFRASLFLLIGLAGTLLTQIRGCEIALLLCLLFLAALWAKSSKHAVYLFISGLMASTILFVTVTAVVGPETIWNRFNRGQSAEGIESASGRTELWAFVVRYCTTHPWGMGYVDGFRVIFRQYYSLSTGQNLSQLGTAHNTYFDVLAGAGWLALAVYLIIIAKTVKLAWRFARRQTSPSPATGSATRHAIRCALVLLVFCLAYGMGATEFSAPLRAGFYILYIIIAIILGASAGMIADTRTRNIFARAE